MATTMKTDVQIPSLTIGDLNVKVPIIQGGMGVGISMANLSAAVANEGGIGVISVIGLNAFDKTLQGNFFEANRIALANEIKKARSMTKGILGVNVMVAITDFDGLLQTALDEQIDVAFLGAGLPLKNLPKDALEKRRTKFVPIVSSARAAKLICKVWLNHYGRVPDAFVVEGPLAGGHLGFSKEQIDDPAFSLETIFPQVLESVKPFEEQANQKIPIIAAGGIYSGADIYHFLQMGAQGVQMGTRFVATHECDADLAFKQAYIDSKQSDLVIIDSPVGLPGRAIKNKFIDDVVAGAKKPFKCLKKCLKTCDYLKAPYCIYSALYNAKLGNLINGFAFAGYNAYRIEKIISVKQLIAELLDEYMAAALLAYDPS
jgi:nitronate monooxygenase